MPCMETIGTTDSPILVSGQQQRILQSVTAHQAHVYNLYTVKTQSKKIFWKGRLWPCKQPIK